MAGEIEKLHDDRDLAIDRRTMLRAEIDASIMMFFEGNNIAARVLAWAALDVLRGILQNRNQRTFHETLEDHVKEEFVKSWRSILRDHYTYFKHADRDPDRVINDYRLEATSYNILGAISDYAELYKSQTVHMAAMKSWMFVRYPSILRDNAPFKEAEMRKLVGNAENSSFEASLVFARDRLREFRALQHEIVEHLPDDLLSAFDDFR